MNIIDDKAANADKKWNTITNKKSNTATIKIINPDKGLETLNNKV